MIYKVERVETIVRFIYVDAASDEAAQEVADEVADKHWTQRYYSADTLDPAACNPSDAIAVWCWDEDEDLDYYIFSGDAE